MLKYVTNFYYVTPKTDRANNFESEVNSFTSLIDTPAGYQDVYTAWNPNEIPGLLDNWTILSKAVIRLGGGETGEIHCKDKIYQKISETDIQGGRTYAPRINTQLYCRWYGAPTYVYNTTVPQTPTYTPAYGDANLRTVWILESGKKLLHI